MWTALLPARPGARSGGKGGFALRPPCRRAEALTARQALELGTIHGARCLGQEAEIGSLEAGKLADVALWRVDGLGHARGRDLVAALVLCPPRPVDLLLVGGEPVVENGELKTADEQEITRELANATKALASETQKLAEMPGARAEDPKRADHGEESP